MAGREGAAEAAGVELRAAGCGPERDLNMSGLLYN